MKIYKCNHCDSTLNDEKITLGSSSEKQFKFENRVVNKNDNRNILSMSSYSDLHFCNKNCFVKYFFLTK